MEFSIVPVPANPDCLICLSADEAREERKAEAEELLARIKAEDAKAAKAKPAPEDPRLFQNWSRPAHAVQSVNELRQWTPANTLNI